MESMGACPKCTAWNHDKRHCPKLGYPCKVEVGGTKCKRYHDPLLHDSKNKFCEAAFVQTVASLTPGLDTRVLLGVQQVPVSAGKGAGEARALWDSGATISLCTHEWARSQELRGEPASVFMKVVHHHHEEITSQV